MLGLVVVVVRAVFVVGRDYEGTVFDWDLTEVLFFVVAERCGYLVGGCFWEVELLEVGVLLGEHTHWGVFYCVFKGGYC